MNTLNDHIADLLRRNPDGLSVPSITALCRIADRHDVFRELGNLILRDRVQCIPGPTDDTTIYKWIPQ